MRDLKASALTFEEVDGLDESVDGVPAPNEAYSFATEYALPTVVPKRVRPAAVVALVLAFVMPIVAIPLAYRVIRKLQHDGGRGRGVVNAAIVIGYLNILLIALIALNLAVAAFLQHSA